jgi:hypothetical protein
MSSQPVPKKRGPGIGPQPATEARAEEIAETIRDGSFRHGVTLKAFAEKWGLAYQRVAELSGLAAKKVRAELTDPETATARGFARLEKIAEEAMLDADEKGNNAQHRKVAIAATETFFKLSGLTAPTKVNVTGLESLTDEQLEARERELLARIQARGKKA